MSAPQHVWSATASAMSIPQCGGLLEKRDLFCSIKLRAPPSSRFLALGPEWAYEALDSRQACTVLLSARQAQAHKQIRGCNRAWAPSFPSLLIKYSAACGRGWPIQTAGCRACPQTVRCSTRSRRVQRSFCDGGLWNCKMPRHAVLYRVVPCHAKRISSRDHCC